MIEIDYLRIGITVINFVILLLILRRFLFKPVNDVLTSRRDEIDSTIKKANEDEANAVKNRAESEKNLKESRAKGKDIVEEYKAKAEHLSNDILKDAHTEAQTIMDRAMKEANREKEKAEAELKEHVVDLAVLLSSKALEESIDEEQHRRLIKDFIAKVGI